MSDWDETTLGQVCSFKGGNAFPQDEQGSRTGAAPFIKVSDLSLSGNDSTISRANNWVSESQISTLRLSLFPAGSSVFAKIGEGMKSERVRRLTTPTAIDNNLMAAVPAPTTDPQFLYYLLQTVRLASHAVGSALPYLKQSTLQAVPVAIPTRPEQQAIAEVLGALDDKIAANTARAATADLYASTVLLGSLGAGRVRLASVAHITMGSSPKGDTLNELGQGVPFYQGVRDFGFRSPTRRVFTTAPVRSANAGDILVSVRAPVGDVNVADEPVCIGRGIAAVRSTTGAQATLLHQLKAERNAWEPFEAEGTVFGSINRDQLHGIQLHVVAPERVEFVEEELAAIESSIAATLAENRTLAATRDALLPQLMSGKLRVRDAEDLIVRASV